jgi:hypothetical protein
MNDRDIHDGSRLREAVFLLTIAFGLMWLFHTYCDFDIAD